MSLPPVALTAWSSLTPAPMDVYQAMTIGSISGGLSLGAAQPQLILIVHGACPPAAAWAHGLAPPEMAPFALYLLCAQMAECELCVSALYMLLPGEVER
eukprot:SAG25_NODE_305_length_10124_cov_16.774464_10_plen_99_part_00